jgi:hypothetical protein
MNLLRVLIASLTLMVAFGGAACKRRPADSMISAVPAPLATPTDAEPDLKPASEIELRRIYSGCRGCGDYSLTLRRGGGDIFADASVIRTELDTKKQRQGTLDGYYYNHLIQLIKSQGVFEMEDGYEMEWFDALVVRLNVSIGERHKTILTSNEGHVPLKLWGLYMAIDGAAAHTKWNDSK